MSRLAITFSICMLLMLLLKWPSPAAAASSSDSDSGDQVYIVYMGAAHPTNLAAKKRVIDSLTSTRRLGSTRELNLATTYQHALSGFAAVMSPEEAASISQQPGVLSVFKDSYYQPLTTRSWDFLDSMKEIRTDDEEDDDDDSIPRTSSDDVVIGIIDSGIWPESESFRADKASRTPPAGWKGTCQTSDDFKKSACNGKIVGARSFVNESVRDTYGHGSHVASKAAGRKVKTSFYGLAAGTVRGGSQHSRIAVYKACSLQHGCSKSAILSAFDYAISDGVKVISVSLGSPDPLEFIEDPIAIGAYHAVERGITVVCAAGNRGPAPGTVKNYAPWIITVAGSTIDRDFRANVLLGGGTIIQGEGIVFPELNRSAVYPLIYGKAAKQRNATDRDARTCQPGSLSKSKIEAKIVFCQHKDNYINLQLDEVFGNGGLGIILVDNLRRRMPDYYINYPVSVISSEESVKVVDYLKTTRKPVATILPTVTVNRFKPAPEVAVFSSRGPSELSPTILNPDITAPGVNILAAWTGNDSRLAPRGRAPPRYSFESGTSMACPHISGVAATVMSAMPFLSPAGVKSAIMTTAVSTNNVASPITNDDGKLAKPYDMGSGVVHPAGAVSPGLVYETTAEEFLLFLCYHGYNTSTVKAMSTTASPSFSCPAGGAKQDLISSVNYPSISVRLSGGDEITILRRLTNVAAVSKAATREYKVSVEVDERKAVKVKVFPKALQFTDTGESKEFKVRFVTKRRADADEEKVVTGSIKWSNHHFTVRSVFVVTIY